MPAAWRQMRVSDLQAINQIADEIHVDLPESPEVFAEKFMLSPTTCFARVQGYGLVGYAIAHPWLLGSIPPLDRLLGRLPTDPDCIYMHDVAVRASARDGHASAEIIALMQSAAARMGLTYLAMVSVYGTDRLWARFGFTGTGDPELDLSSYGPSARYMRKLIR